MTTSLSDLIHQPIDPDGLRFNRLVFRHATWLGSAFSKADMETAKGLLEEVNNNGEEHFRAVWFLLDSKCRTWLKKL